MEQVSMTQQRDLLLVPFPFSDQTGKKVRPVIIVSTDEFNKNSEDVIVVGVTSNISKNRYTVNLTKSSLDEGTLFTDCSVKVENILRLDKELIIKKIGRINKDTLIEIVNKLNEIIKK